jgi:hypothetical protein
VTNGKEISTPCTYRIRILGLLEECWSDWFYGFTIQQQPPNITTLTGRVIDQAALYGVLSKISELGFFLLSVDMLHYDEDNWQAKFERSESCKLE